MLPSSLFLFTNILAVSLSLPVVTDASSLRQLGSTDFNSSIQNGVWFVEFFSPYCGHCKHFLPTWERLSEYVENQQDPGITLAQVNCIAQTDLCDQVDIRGYPTLSIYRDGQFVEHYTDDRSYERLTAYIDTKAHKLQPNPDGKVLALTPNTFEGTVKQGPVFVKFFAPWCGHCKKLAPTWTQFASAMRDKLTVAEVNCDDYKSLCTAQNIPGFPSIVFYQHGLRHEYTGRRALEEFKAFADAALAPPVSAISPSEVTFTIEQQDVLYLLIHDDTALDYHLKDNLREASKALHGTPKIFTTSSTPELLSSLSLPETQPLPVLLSIKDHSQQPFHTLDLSDAPPLKSLSQWISKNKLATLTQLGAENFAHVMTEDRLVVLVALHPDDTKNIELTKQMATKWVREDAKKTKEDSQKHVVFAWMDKFKYASWLKSLYGIRPFGHPSVVLVDHERLLYYDVMPNGSPIPLDLAGINAALQAVADGVLIPKNSENWLERIARRVSNMTLAIQTAVSNHPFLAIALAGSVVFAIISKIKKSLREDAFASSSLYVNSKSGTRLD